MTELRREAPIKTLRQAAGVTQRELAEALDVSIPAVCRWEDGTAWPTIDKLPAMAALLRVPLEELVRSLIRTREGGSDGAV